VNISKPHFSVPIPALAWHKNVANITLPDAAVLRSFSKMEVENTLTCRDAEGRMDQSCPAWDHNIALGVACAPTHEEAFALLQARLLQEQGRLDEPGGFAGELARYVTPFRRRIGKWLTPATDKMPMLTDTKNRSCSFHVQNPGWVNSFKLRFSGSAAADGAPPTVTTPLFTGGGFTSTYNANRTLMITPPVCAPVCPAGGCGAACCPPCPAPAGLDAGKPRRKVQLSFILSGHGELMLLLVPAVGAAVATASADSLSLSAAAAGDMEFDASTHVFDINGVSFSWTSEGVAGTGMGCSKHVREGRVQPNEHGTWYTGRNFWCNGADVPVHVADVTAAVNCEYADPYCTEASPVNVTVSSSSNHAS